MNVSEVISLSEKRRAGEEVLERATKSPKARLNRSVLRKLQRTLVVEPETNLLDVFPSSYTVRLASRGEAQRTSQDPAAYETRPLEQMGFMDSSADLQHLEDDPYCLRSTPTTVASPLSETVLSLLGLHDRQEASLNSDIALSRALAEVIKAGEIIWPSAKAEEITRKVIKLDADLILKINMNDGQHTEHFTMRYLEHHKPEFPAPRAHGLLVGGAWRFCFMSLMPGESLNLVWPSLNESEKRSISEQLHALFLSLRKLPFTTGLLGAVSGPVCTDSRREVRMTTEPIRTIDEFDHFRFSNPLFGSPTYLKFLQQISKEHQPTMVTFTHGDVRTENILVKRRCDGTYMISGVIDWETSGFYPEDFECTKITNTMSPNDDDDWFNFLPHCIAPARYPTRWLLDRMWAKHVQ